MPTTLETRLMGVNGTLPEVKALRLDTNFDAVNPNQFVV